MSTSVKNKTKGIEREGELLFASEKSLESVSSFSVWRKAPRVLDSDSLSRKLDKELDFGEHKPRMLAGTPLYLITPEDGRIIIEESDLSFAKIREILNREIVEMKELARLQVADIIESGEPDAEGNGIISVVVESDLKDQGPAAERERLLGSIGAQQLVLPDFKASIDLISVPGYPDLAGAMAIVENHMPEATPFNPANAVLSYTTPMSHPQAG